MKDLANTYLESVKIIGQTFFISFYLPSFVFSSFHLIFLFPLWSNSYSTISPDNLFDFLANQGSWLYSLAAILLMPLFIGILLVGLNNFIILLFEGRYRSLKFGLLYPLTRLNTLRCKSLYGRLSALEDEYHRVTMLLNSSNSAEENDRLKQQVESLALQINEEHKKIESVCAFQILPRNISRISPTAYGNAYAIAEEYSYDRYGMDSVLYWPRLQEIVGTHAPYHSERLSHQKAVLDLLTNLSFLTCTLFFETGLTLRLRPSELDGLMVSFALVFGIIGISSYKGSVSAVQTLGLLIMTSFDLYRGLLLKSFGLNTPNDLLEEQVVWIKLATFIRRGNDFYFPSNWHASEDRINDHKKTEDN
jgi:hypothetical protein